MGKLGVNYESHLTAQRLALRLGVPCLCSASKLNYDAEGEKWIVETESEFGTPEFEASAPFVVTADLRLAEPRFPSLPNIVKARRKSVYEVGMARVESDFSASVGTLRQAHASKKCCQYIDAESLMHIISGGR